MSEEFRQEVLEQLRGLNSDVSRPHKFDFFLYFLTEGTARSAALKVQESEFETQVVRSAADDGWLCRASVTIVPETAPLSEIGDFFDQIATALNGDFDGWESDVITVD